MSNHVICIYHASSNSKIIQPRLLVYQSPRRQKIQLYDASLSLVTAQTSEEMERDLCQKFIGSKLSRTVAMSELFKFRKFHKPGPSHALLWEDHGSSVHSEESDSASLRSSGEEGGISTPSEPSVDRSESSNTEQVRYLATQLFFMVHFYHQQQVKLILNCHHSM